jgi:AcrR family transcriptional regulator
LPKMSDAYLEARRKAILDAATAVFVRKGIPTATMADIAEQAGLTAGAIYRYYKSKDELADACLGEVASAITQQWLEPPSEERAELDFARLARATFALLGTPAVATSTVMHLESVLNAVRDRDASQLAASVEEQRKICEGVARYISAGQARGEISATADAFVLAEALYMFYQGACLALLLNPQINVLAHLEQIVQLLQLSAPDAGRADAPIAVR